MNSSNVNWIAVGATAAAIAITGTGYVINRLRRAGLFQMVLLDWKDLPNNKRIMFKSFKGNYRNVRRSIEQLHETLSELPNDALETQVEKEMWGVYFDDPDRAGHDNCRYSLGFVLKTDASRQAEEFLTKRGFTLVDNIPAGIKTVHNTFPFTGMLSVMVCLARVYPAIWAECKRSGFERTSVLKEGENEDGCFVEITRPKDRIMELYYTPFDVPQLTKVRAKD